MHCSSKLKKKKFFYYVSLSSLIKIVLSFFLSLSLSVSGFSSFFVLPQKIFFSLQLTGLPHPSARRPPSPLSRRSFFFSLALSSPVNFLFLSSSRRPPSSPSSLSSPASSLTADLFHRPSSPTHAKPHRRSPQAPSPSPHPFAGLNVTDRSPQSPIDASVQSSDQTHAAQSSPLRRSTPPPSPPIRPTPFSLL